MPTPLPGASQGLVMMTTSMGVIVHWPDTNLASALDEHNSGITAEMPRELPYQAGRELPADGILIDSEEAFGDNNPKRQVFASASAGGGEATGDDFVSAEEPSRKGETSSQRCTRQENNHDCAFRRHHIRQCNLLNDLNEEGVFRSPTANIMAVVRLFDILESSPMIDKAKAQLEAAALQCDALDQT